MSYDKNLREQKVREYLRHLAAVIVDTEFSEDETLDHSSPEAKKAREIAAEALLGMAEGAFVQSTPQELALNLLAFYQRQASLMRNPHDDGAIEALTRLTQQIGAKR